MPAPKGIRGILAALDKDGKPRACNPPFGFSDRFAEYPTPEWQGSGIYDINMTPVPADKLYVAQFVYARNNTRNPTFVVLRITDNSDWYIFKWDNTVVKFEAVTWQYPIVMIEGDYIQCKVYGCTEGDAVEGGFWGYIQDL